MNYVLRSYEHDGTSLKEWERSKIETVLRDVKKELLKLHGIEVLPL